MLVSTFRSMFVEEFLEPWQRSTFGEAWTTMFHPRFMIGDENPASFTIESSVFRGSLLVLGLGPGEGEVDG